jgi:hypothetical protein
VIPGCPGARSGLARGRRPSFALHREEAFGRAAILSNFMKFDSAFGEVNDSRFAAKRYAGQEGMTEIRNLIIRRGQAPP